MSFFFLVQVQVERSGDGVGGKQERESRRQDLRLFSRPRLASCRNSVIELASDVFVKSRWMHRNERRSSERRCKSTLKPIFFFFSRHHHHHHRRRRRRKNSKTHRRHPRHRTPSPKRRHRRRHCCQSPVEFSIGKKKERFKPDGRGDGNKLATTSHQTSFSFSERSLLPRAAASTRAATMHPNHRGRARDKFLAAENNRRGREGRKDEESEARAVPLLERGAI